MPLKLGARVSDTPASIECMFESMGVAAGVDHPCDALAERRQLRTPTAESVGWVQRIGAAARAENRAAAAQLIEIGQLFAYRLSRCSETEDWAVDTMEAVAAEVAAGLRISQGLAASRLRYARALRERLPKTGAVFAAGQIDLRAFQTIVFRTDLIVDPQVMAAVDELVALNVGRWPSMTKARLSGQVDAIVARADADAVRRRKERHADREIWIGQDADGMSRIDGSMFTIDAHALDRRLSALAATVCPQPGTAARGCARGAGRRWRPVGMSLRAPGLCGRCPARCPVGGDPCDRRTGHTRRRRRGSGLGGGG